MRQYLGTFDTAEEAKAAYDEVWEERKERTVEELNGEWAPKEVDIILIQIQILAKVKRICYNENGDER